MSQADEATPLMAASYPARTALADLYGARPLGFPELQAGVPQGIDVLVWAAHGRRLPAEASDPAVIAHLKRFLSDGGGLFLVGFAQSFVVDLGLETIRPDRADFHRVNHNDASPPGSVYAVGLSPTGDCPLVAGLEPAPGGWMDYFVGGGAAVILESCCWVRNPPRHARTLATFCRIDELGERRADPDCRVLNLWEFGKGKVLGYGNNVFLEESWYNPWRDNLLKFLSNAARFLSAGKVPAIAALPEAPALLWADDYMQVPAFPVPQPHSLQRRFPGLPYISHWGWHAQVDYQRAERRSVDVAYYRTRLIDEPFRWGCNLLEYYPPDMTDGYPFAWDPDDPIPPPKAPSAYWGGNFDPLWDKDGARHVFQTAHDRDMTVQVFYHPDPVRRPRGASSVDHEAAALDFTEFQAREFQNPLLHGWRKSHDGMGSEWWADDRRGEHTARLWLYNPGSYRYSTALLPRTTPNFAGAWMCAFGRSAAINACGFGESWRYVFHPPLYLSYQADCRSMKPSTREWGGWANYGGGSTPDWLLAQVSVFARDRLYLDSGIWWLGEPAATLREEERQYVYGISADPLRCAVTSTMRAVGADGYRAKAANSVPRIHANYACSEPFAQDTAFIQNNYFRLLRLAGEDRGVLEYDPTRLAHFSRIGRPRPAIELSCGFLTADPVGVQLPFDEKSPVVAAVGMVDGSGAEFRGEGGYGRRCRCDARASGFPAKIGYETWPAWPHEIEFAFEADAGRYNLEIYHLPAAYACTMEVEVDGCRAGCYFPQVGMSGRQVLPFGLTRPGRHALLLRAQKAETDGRRSDGQPGMAHAFDAVIIRRVAGDGVTHEHPLAAGHVAALDEMVVKDAKGRYRQRRSYRVCSDTPALRVHIASEAPEPTAWEIRIALPGYDGPEPLSGGGYRLAAPGTGRPALCLFLLDGEPEGVARRGDDLVVVTRKMARSELALGFLIDDGLYPPADLSGLRAALFDPVETIEVGEAATEHWGRHAVAVCRVVRIEHPTGRPYQVAEWNRDGERFWLARGAQAHGDVDFLKLYMQPGRAAKVQAYGFIEGVVKAGFGCQYMMAIKDTVRPGTCEVEVVKTGPFVFAPRLEWRHPFDTARLNGAPWRYFDAPLVYLPNRPGRYVVEVEVTGMEAPTIGRTFLDVRRAAWDAQACALELETTMPHWWEGPLPGDIGYTVQILSSSYEPIGVEGDGEVIRWSEYRARPADVAVMSARGAVLRMRPGKAWVRFRPR